MSANSESLATPRGSYRPTQGTRGAFVDSRGVRWDTNHPDYVGYLTKKSRWMGEWRRRFFILKGSKMFFAKDEESTPHGMIDLVDCVRAKPAQDNTSRRSFAFEIVLKDQRFVMCAESSEEQMKFLQFIGRALERHSSVAQLDEVEKSTAQGQPQDQTDVADVAP